jgi:hypothetical protein
LDLEVGFDGFVDPQALLLQVVMVLDEEIDEERRESRGTDGFCGKLNGALIPTGKE